jgi:hypothetical protein
LKAGLPSALSAKLASPPLGLLLVNGQCLRTTHTTHTATDALNELKPLIAPPRSSPPFQRMHPRQLNEQQHHLC